MKQYKKIVLFFSLILSLSAADLSKEFKAQNKEIVKLVVKEVSKNIPQKVDKYTQLTGINSKELTLTYIFEIFTGAKSDDAVRKEDKERMEKVVKNGICRSSKRFLDAGIDISYRYNSTASKEMLFQFDVSRADCVATWRDSGL